MNAATLRKLGRVFLYGAIASAVLTFVIWYRCFLVCDRVPQITLDAINLLTAALHLPEVYDIRFLIPVFFYLTVILIFGALAVLLTETYFRIKKR